MNKKGALGSFILIILLLIMIIELGFCGYAIYSCSKGNCIVPNFYGLGKYMVIPAKLISGNLTVIG
jgi:hypothetical protein